MPHRACTSLRSRFAWNHVDLERLGLGLIDDPDTVQEAEQQVKVKLTKLVVGQFFQLSEDVLTAEDLWPFDRLGQPEDLAKALDDGLGGVLYEEDLGLKVRRSVLHIPGDLGGAIRLRNPDLVVLP